MRNMNRGASSWALAGLLLTADAAARAPQSPPAATAADVQQMAAAARKDVDSYKAAGGAAGAADHPAIKWDAAMWPVHERAPQSEAGASAALEAIRLLTRAELWDRAH